MYIHPFALGVLATLAAEFLAIIIVITTRRKK